MFRYGQAPFGRFLPKLGVALFATAVLSAAGAASAKETLGQPATVLLASLPPQAQQVHKLILVGGPFEYRKDGAAFGNRERLLPAQTRGYYREYTVKTPGSYDRGARRIVCGGTQPAQPEACFYTADHYASFSRIVQ